uniref:Natural cytotoxicity triggering receptor 3 n=1 Tax=Ginglymostoma cirratum TaxID=7801 RepID=A0A8A9WQJ1_GINCI|nr:natural cytotoxicity triggering receptor 3 [Ginglymostoma cirratum]
MHWIAVTWITAVLSAAAVENITVIQSPNSLTKTPGQAARLGCTYEGPSGIGSYTWHRGNKRGNEVSNNTAEFRGRVFSASQGDFRDRRDASIRIIDLKPEDTGFYICEVVFLGMREAYGTGTTLIVTRGKLPILVTQTAISTGMTSTSGNNGSSAAESKPAISPFVFAMAVLVPVLIIIVVTVIVKYSRKTATPEQLESMSNPLYADMHDRGE